VLNAKISMLAQSKAAALPESVELLKTFVPFGGVRDARVPRPKSVHEGIVVSTGSRKTSKATVSIARGEFDRDSDFLSEARKKEYCRMQRL
jgi:hypothetical protein